MDTNLITVNKNAIVVLAKEAENLVIKKEAEKELIKLLQLKELIDATIEQVKQNIADSGRKLYPDFKAIVGERVKIITRYYGDRYATDGTTPEEFIKTTIIKRVDSGKVDEYMEEQGKLPDGITEREREEKVVISLKKE